MNGMIEFSIGYISGYYFANHFVMGGDRFESTKQDIYLFGDNEDLNFLGSRPFAVKYLSFT